MFRFRDTDITGEEDRDITGQDYVDLIETCMRYCRIISMRVPPLVKPKCACLEKYRLEKPLDIAYVYDHYYDKESRQAKEEIRYYWLTPEVKDFLLNTADSVFKWICAWGYTNPEDLAFYRTDGSVFFYSTIHEGECVLAPNSDEDVVHIISDSFWTKDTMEQF